MTKSNKNDASQWETLANEAIQDAGQWKAECRKMQSKQAALVAVANAARALLEVAKIDGDYESREVLEVALAAL